MTLALELQIELPESESIMLPTQADFEHWISTALDKANHQDEVALTLRIVEEAEGRELNARWRGKDYATNVLSFPLEMPEHAGHSLYRRPSNLRRSSGTRSDRAK